MIVAGDQQDAAMPRSSRMIHVLEDIAAAIDTGAFAVPQRKHAVIFCGPEQINLLRAPDCRCRQFFIHCGPEFDVVPCQVRRGFPGGLVQPAEWRAAITRDEASGIEPGCGIPYVLQNWQPNERLNAAQIDGTRGRLVLVVKLQTVVDDRHGALSKIVFWDFCRQAARSFAPAYVCERRLRIGNSPVRARSATRDIA